MTDHLRHFSKGVVEVPGRRFPGIVIMGDTLASMAYDVECALNLMKHKLECDRENLEVDRLEYVLERLNAHLSIYEEVLQKEGMQFPYAKRNQDQQSEDM